MKIVIASDHAGFCLKLKIISFFKKNKIQFEDLGTHSEESVDYPDFAALVARKISDKEAERGILICGTGVGMAITANKFKGVRAASITDLFMAQMAREHNNLNVLCLGSRILKNSQAEEIVNVFLNTPFAGDRHERRVEKIKNLEK